MDVLVADDDAVTRRTLEKLLGQWGFSVECVDNGSSAWDRLSGGDAPSIVILDWMMPGLNGVELCQRIRERAEEPPSSPELKRLSIISMTPIKRKYTYVVLLTGRDCRHDIVRGLEAGADDYVVKPIRPPELRARLLTGVRILELERQLLSTQAALRERATKDPLTGLWNRGAILEILEQEVARFYRESNPLTVQIVDLDHFKTINDTHGHLVGDAVLREAADQMGRALRKSDWIGRYGGEEFLIVQPNCNREHGTRVAERLREEIATTPIVLDGRQIDLTLSVGSISVEISRDDINSWDLLREADDALYEAKQQGRNRVVATAIPDPLVGEALPVPS